MNGRERIGIAMARGEPDRVPVFCQLAIGHYFLHARPSPVDIWFRSAAFADALVELQRRYGFDGILVNLPGRDPDFEREVDRVEPGDGETTVRWRDGSFTRVPRDDNPHRLRPDGTRPLPAFEAVDPDALYYVEPWDLTGITYPGRRGFPPWQLDALREVQARSGDGVSVHAEVFSPFSQLLELVGYEAALMALLDDPGKVRACLERLARGATDLAIAQLRAGADAVLISSAFAGAGLISRAHYAEFVLPFERRVVEGAKAAMPGAVVYTHTCGAIGDRLDLMLATGTDGIDTLDPPPLGTVELADAVPQLQGRAFVKGNLDAVNTLLHGDDDAVRRAVLECLRVAMPGGGYILSSACSVAPHVAPARLELLGALAREHGVYR